MLCCVDLAFAGIYVKREPYDAYSDLDFQGVEGG